MNGKKITGAENPFDLTKASDFSDTQVMQYWVDVANENKSLVNFLKPRSLVPTYLLGGKGSGKTHLMRYCSSAVQTLRHPDLRSAVLSEGYLGIYASADGLNAYRFSGKGIAPDVWEDVFAYSFELFLAGTLLSSLRPALLERELASNDWMVEFSNHFGKLFTGLTAQPPETLDGIIEFLDSLRRQVDLAVNNSAIRRSLDGIQIHFRPGDLVFGIPRILADVCEFASKLIFVYLIDEVENFTEQQQRFLNTLVRYRRGNVTLRIGARLYGIRTHSTLGSGEPIKRDAEFEEIVLDELLREDRDYDELATQLILKRLETFSPAAHITPDSLASQFAELSSANYYQEETLRLVSQRDTKGQLRPHLARLLAAVESALQDKRLAGDLVESLSIKEFPLLEKTNVLALLKRAESASSILQTAKEIREECNNLVQLGPTGSRSYNELYSHFSSDLLAQLYRDYGRRPVYAGFRTLVRLSQGVPRNLLSLMKHIYRRSLFAGENPFIEGKISVEVQSLGVLDASEWFWEDAQPDEFGSLVRSTVEHIATLLRSIRYSDNPSECDLCCFSVNSTSLSANARQALKYCENWSFILRIPTRTNAKNNDRVIEAYQINPMLSPRWGISESRRGLVELNSDLANLLLSDTEHIAAQAAITTRVDAMSATKALKKLALSEDGRQANFFDDF